MLQNNLFYFIIYSIYKNEPGESARMKAKKFLFLLTVLLLFLTVAACTTKMVTVSFYADGVLYEEIRVEKGSYVEDIPPVPEKPGYIGVWSDNELVEVNDDLRVDAIYTRNSYTVTFRADGRIIATRTVVSGKTISNIPDVPEKEGYSGAWSISQTDFSSLTSDTVVDAVYTRLDVYVTFYKNSFTYAVAPVKTGNPVEPNTYYVLTDDYALTEDAVFQDGVTYYTRTRDFFGIMSAEEGKLVGSLPEPPAQEGYSVKWMQINSTPTGDILTTPDFNNVESSFSVVAYPYITVSLVDNFTNRRSSVSYDIGQTVSSVRPLAVALADYEFYAWYLDESLKEPVSFPCLFSHNVTLYAKWIGTRATDGVMIEDGKVVGYNGTATDVYIPIKYSVGESTAYVTGISAAAFKNSSVVSVSIPATVTEIGDSAFYGCSSLATVLFPDGNYVRTYGDSVFRGCSSLKSFGFSDKTSRIGSYAFYGCSSLVTVAGLENSALDKAERFLFAGCGSVTSLSLPAGLRIIEEKAFSGMTNAAIVFADQSSVERIGSFAFENCKKFVGFMSEKMREMGESPFRGCSSLTSATVFGAYKTPVLFGKTAPESEEENAFYPVTADGSTYYVPKALFNVLVIPTQTGEVITDVLYDCYTVKNVRIADRAQKVSSYAFRLEHYLPSSTPFNVYFPETLTSIAAYAFYSRNDLTAVELPIRLEEIGEYAFSGIASLRSVTLDAHAELDDIGRDAFSGTSWYNTYSGVITLGKVVLGISEEYCRKATYYEIPADSFRSYSVIAPYAFAGNTVLQKITLSDTISRVGDNAFAGCTALTSFAFKKYVATSFRQLGTTVLDGCLNLYDLTVCEDIDADLLFSAGIPDSLRTLRIENSLRDDTLFANTESGFCASSLTGTSVANLYVGDGFTQIGECAFRNVTSLAYLSISDTVTMIGANAFSGCTALEDVVGLAGLVTVSQSAFDGCSVLATFAFAPGLTEIGDYAFRDCAFSSFTAPAALSNIGESAFDGCSSLKTAVLNDRIVSVGDYAFRDCDLSELTLPASVSFLTEENEFVGEQMLAGNTSFKSLTLYTGVTAARLFGAVVPTTFVRVLVNNCALADDQFNGLSTIMTVNLSNVTAIGDRAFFGCSSLQHIVVPSSVVSIGESAFEGCSSLNSCQIDTAGTVLTAVNKKAFKNCSSLKYVVFPNTVTQGDWTEIFSGCASLVNTNIPSAIVEIGAYAYCGCEKLSSLRMHNNVEKIGDSAFKDCLLLELDNVSFDALSSIGENAFENCEKLTNFRAENVDFIGENAYKNCLSLTEITVGENAVSYYAGTEILSGLSVINVAAHVGAVDVDTYLTGCTSVSSVVVYSENSAFPARSFAEKLNDLTSNKGITFLSVPLYENLGSVVQNVFCKPSQMSFEFSYDEEKRTATIVGLASDSSADRYVYLPESVTRDDKSYLVTAIGGSAFFGSHFSYVVIPSSVTEIGNAAFSQSSVETVVFESGSKCLIIGDNAFKESAVTAISVPSSVEKIGGSAFDGCASLSRVSFFAGSNLRMIGDNAFNGTTSLTSVIFTGPIQYVGSSAFSGSGVRTVDFGSLATFTGVSEYAFASSRLENVVLPDTVQRVEEGAFSGFAGESFVCPDRLSYIGAKAFYKANAMKNFTFASGMLSIGSEAFYGNSELEKIILPDGLTSVGASAFAGCEKVTSLTIGTELKSVGVSAFDGLLRLALIEYNARLLSDLSIDNNVFRNGGVSGTGISVLFGQNVTALPNNLFYSSVIESELPKIDSVQFCGTPMIETIGENAFRGDKNLCAIVLPATILFIGSGAFVGCENAVIESESAKMGKGWALDYKDNDNNVLFGARNKRSGDYSYVLYDDGAVVTDYFGGSDVTVPSLLEGKPVFATGVTFEDGTARFIVLPDTVILPGSYDGCSSLVGITMQEGPLAIAKKAFNGCSSLLYFKLPGSVVTIGDGAFSGCDALSTVYLSNTQTVEKMKTEKLSETCGGLFNSAQSVYIHSSLDVTLPASMIVKNDTTRTYNKVLSDLNGYAVWSTLYWRSSSAVSATYVYLLNDWTPDSEHDEISSRYNLFVEGIGAMKEYGNSLLIPWREYSSLIGTVTIGRNVTSLGRYAFKEMLNLTEVRFMAEACEDSDASKQIFSSEENATGSGFKLVVGNNVTTLPSYLFYGNRYLSAIEWNSDRLRTIGTSAFEGCTGLISVSIPNCVTYIGARAFFGCSKAETLTIGQGVKSFGNAAFGDFGADMDGFYLQQIYYNALSAENELSDVFSSSYKLGANDTGTELVVHKSVLSVPDYLFCGFDRLIQITFAGESSVRSIGQYSFENCVNLRSVSVPLSVTTIGRRAFAGCTLLSAIDFADNNKISFIGEKAFYDTQYYNLDSGSVSNWVDGVLYMNGRKFLLEARSSIGEDYAVLEGTDVIAEKAFASNAYLRYITIPSSVDVICSEAFVNCVSLKTVFIVSSVVISGLSTRESQGELCKNATVIYCRSDLLKNGNTKVGEYLSDTFHLAETDTLRNGNQYYSFTKLYWQCAKQETESTVYAYLLNDFTHSGYYRMEVAGVGEMTDYSSRTAPWYSFEDVDYSTLITTVTFGKAVTSVGNYAFRSFTKLDNVIYNNSDALASIGDFAFAGCSSLTKIEIGKAVTHLGKGAFSACGSVVKISFNAVACEDLTADNNVFYGVGADGDGAVLEIDNEVLCVPAYLCYPAISSNAPPKIIEIKFLNGIGNQCASVGDFAFAYCEDVRSLTMDGNSLKIIGEGAFYSCKKLSALTIPSGVISIAYNAFGMCVNVGQITLRASDCTVDSRGVFYMVGREVAAGVIVSFTDTVRVVPERFLYNAEDTANGAKVTLINFPEDDKSRCEVIKKLAFGYCSEFTSLTLPKTLTTIEEGAFYGCTSLKTFVTPFIGGVSNAVSASYNTMFGYVFHTDTEDPDDAHVGMTLTTQSYNGIDKLNYYIPDSIQYVTVTHYTNIYYGAFQNCVNIINVETQLSSIEMIVDEEQNVAVNNGYLIGAYAFSGCEALSFVSMTDALTEIGAGAFKDCINLSLVTVPLRVTKIGASAFANTQKLRNVNFNAQFCDDFEEGSDVFLDAGKMQSGIVLTVGNAVRKIPAYFFETSGESKLSEMKMVSVASATLQSIGRNAFNNCVNLTSLSLPGTVTQIGQNAFTKTGFYNSPNNWRGSALYYESSAYKYLLAYNTETGDGSYTVLNDTRVIADAAFMESTVIRDVTLPESLVTIGVNAFSECKNLGQVVFRVNENTRESALTTIGAGAFRNCKLLEEITITKNVEAIGDEAFDGCAALTVVRIDSVAVSSSVSTESAAGYLCNHARYVYVHESISTENTGTYIRTRYISRENQNGYNMFEKR